MLTNVSSIPDTTVASLPSFSATCAVENTPPLSLKCCMTSTSEPAVFISRYPIRLPIWKTIVAATHAIPDW